jgi:hypothetical protein
LFFDSISNLSFFLFLFVHLIFQAFEKIRISELITYTNTITGSMEEENIKPGNVELPPTWTERAKYICRYLVVLFSHQFLFEFDLDGLLTNFAEFMEFLFSLIAPHKDILVNSFQKHSNIRKISKFQKFKKFQNSKKSLISRSNTYVNSQPNNSPP